MSKQTLFVGGPKDGERLVVDPTLNVVRFPVLESGSVLSEQCPTFGSVDYRRVRLADGDKVYSIFVYGPESVIETLIRGYKISG